MRNFRSILSFVLFWIILSYPAAHLIAQTNITNKGVGITVKSSSSVYVNGSYTNDSGFKYTSGCVCNGSIKNDGMLYMKDINAVAPNIIFDTTFSGSVIITGSGNNIFTSTGSPIAFRKLIINKSSSASSVNISNQIIVKDTLQLITGNIISSNFIDLHPNAQLVGESESNSVNGTIRVSKYFPAGIAISNNLSGLGLRLKSASNIGTMLLQRSSLQEANAANGSIKKSFSITPGINGTLDSIRFDYFNADTIGTNNYYKSRFKTFISYNNGSQYSNYGGQSDTTNNAVSNSGGIQLKDMRITIADDSCKNKPTIALSDSIKICNGDSVTIDAGNAGLRFLWSSNDTTQTIKIASAGTYWVSVTDNKGCSNYDTVQLITDPKPIASFINPVLICRSNTTVFTNTSSIASGSLTYSWNFDDTTFSSSVSPSKLFSSARVFNVKLVATSDKGCVDSATNAVTVYDKPNVLFSVNDSVCLGTTNIFTNNSTVSGSTLTYLWDFANTQFSSAVSPSLTYASAATYNVKLVATSAVGCADSMTYPVRVFVNPVLTMPDSIGTCSTSLVLDALNPGMKYLWSTSDTTQTITASTDGWYKVTVTSPKGCAVSDSSYIRLNFGVKPNLGADTVACGSIVLDANVPLASYLWSTTDTTRTINVSSSGTYIVRVTDANSCIGFDTVNVTIHSLPVVNLGNDTNICANDSFYLNAGNGTRTYLWMNSSTNSTQIVNSTGTYFVRVTDVNSCVAYDTLNAIVRTSPTVNLGNDTSICSGSSLTLNALNAGASFLWNDLSTLQTNNVSTSGVHWVKVTAVNGCSASDTFNLNLYSLPVVNLGNDTSICSGSSLTLNALNAGSKYLWSNADTTQTTSVNTSGSVWVKVTSVQGCNNNDTIVVGINALPVVNLGNDTSICSGSSLTLNALNIGSKYLWSNADTTQTTSVSSSGSVWVKVTSVQGCNNNDTIVVGINALPVVNLGNDTSICSGSSLTLNALNAGSKYLWSNTDTTQTTSVNTSGSVWVKVTSVQGCNNNDTIVVGINALPVVNLGNDTSICSGSSLTLNALNVGSKYLWSNADTTQTTSVNASGSVWVKVTSVQGCNNNDTIVVGVNALPVVNLGNDTSICGSASLILNALNPGAKYLWSNTDTSQTTSVNTSGSVWVKVTSVQGCAANDTIVVGINALPVVNLGNDTSICSGSSLTLNALNVGSKYLWSNTDTTQTTSVNFSGSVWVKVTSVQGCNNNDTINIGINNLPTLNIGNDTTVCDSLLITANSNATQFLWSNATTNNFIKTASSGIYSAIATNSFGCHAYDTIQVVVNLSPLVFIGNDTTICSNSSTLLNAGNPGAKYLWSNNDTNQTININTSGIYWVGVTTLQGCFNKDTISISLNPVPSVNLGNDTAICSGTSLTLNAFNSGSKFLWSNGDTLQQTTLMTANSYWVTVTNINGCSTTDTLILAINNSPTLDLGSDTSVCDSVIIFSNSNAGTFLWSTSSTNNNIKVATSGTYSAIATSALGCLSFDTIQVTVNSSPSVFIGNDFSICANSGTLLNAGNAGAKYLWSNGDTTQTISINDSGNYWVKVTTIQGCFNKDTIAIGINPLPSVNIGNDTSVCSALVIDAGNSGAKYLWSSGDTTQKILISKTGQYWVEVTNATNCKAYDTVNIIYNSIINFSLGNDSAFCSGNSIKITAPPGNFSYMWSTGDTSRIITVSNSGNYSVLLKDVFGCSVSDTVKITVNPKPVVSLGNDELYCRGTSRFMDAGNAGSAFKWYNIHGTFDTTQTIFAHDSGNYWVQVTNVFGCTSSDTIRMIPTPLLIARFLSASLVEVEDSIQFVDLSYPFDSVLKYKWEFDDGGTSTIGNPVHAYATDGTYLVKLIVTNGICFDTISKPVVVKPKRKVPSTPVTLSIPATDILNFLTYPNPTEDGLTKVIIDMSNRDETTLQVMDMNGKMILSKQLGKIKEYREDYDFSELRAGVYLVRVITNDKKRTLRLIKL